MSYFYQSKYDDCWDKHFSRLGFSNLHFGFPRPGRMGALVRVGANPRVNWRLTLLFGQAIQSVQNKDIHVVLIKPKAIKSFENVATSGEVALTNTSSKKTLTRSKEAGKTGNRDRTQPQQSQLTVTSSQGLRFDAQVRVELMSQIPRNLSWDLSSFLSPWLIILWLLSTISLSDSNSEFSSV